MSKNLSLSGEKIHSLALAELRNFPLFDEKHLIEVFKNDEEIFISYRTEERSPVGTTHFDLQTDGIICYLVHIELKGSQRGHNLGKKLYEAAEDVARSIGCSKIRQFPSGKTFNGETRRDYVKKKLGYEEIFYFSNDVEKVL